MTGFVLSLMCLRCFIPLLLLMVLGGCGPLPPVVSPERIASDAPRRSDPIAALIGTSNLTPPATSPGTLEKMGFSIQVGAFAQVDNAAGFERLLDGKGLDAYYFRDPAGLFKVRFGNHDSYAAARAEAEALQQQGMIEHYFIVFPESYSAAQIKQSGRGDLRDELVRSAQHFIGVPYLWGGESQKGFDCSGLTMVCYRINGLNLPRNSRAQFDKGMKVARDRLQKGDLVFFATHGGDRVTHVGIYAGDGRFIHAPRTGKTVRFAALSSAYWSKAYRGARSYL